MHPTTVNVFATYCCVFFHRIGIIDLFQITARTIVTEAWYKFNTFALRIPDAVYSCADNNLNDIILLTLGPQWPREREPISINKEIFGIMDGSYIVRWSHMSRKQSSGVRFSPCNFYVCAIFHRAPVRD